VDKDGAPAMLNSLMYKMCFYRFGEVMTEYGALLLRLFVCTCDC
jgi:hypothetical protein